MANILDFWMLCVTGFELEDVNVTMYIWPVHGQLVKEDLKHEFMKFTMLCPKHSYACWTFDSVTASAIYILKYYNNDECNDRMKISYSVRIYCTKINVFHCWKSKSLCILCNINLIKSCNFYYGIL